MKDANVKETRTEVVFKLTEDDTLKLAKILDKGMKGGQAQAPSFVHKFELWKFIYSLFGKYGVNAEDGVNYSVDTGKPTEFSIVKIL